ncbi:hypothetical protein ACQP2P_36410 [Dactylosporangium sp. CA-139114]|uniref:hypothetical protein n=1 Tax=Dactylosporangium sp. CA-139114 TaxID=3239931 RepID=UPI003D9660D2
MLRRCLDMGGSGWWRLSTDRRVIDQHFELPVHVASGRVTPNRGVTDAKTGWNSGGGDDSAPEAGPGWPQLWAVHVLVAAAVGGVLWPVSYPGGDSFLFMAGGCASVLIGCCWLGWTVYVARTAGGWRSWFLIGPVIGVLTMVLLCTGAPRKMRWAASRCAFAAVVDWSANFDRLGGSWYSWTGTS